MIKIAPDKWKHFFVGIGLGVVLQAGGRLLLPAHGWLVTGIVLLVIVVISYGFELYSKFTGHGHYEVMDAVASVIGGVLGMALGAGLTW
ncbi:MAG: sialidase family protein [Chitinophagaceae bacterium]